VSSHTMRAMVVSEFGQQPELTELPRPIPKGDELLLRVRAAGVCHTDMKIRDGLVPDVPLPLTLGHEIAGEVDSVGPDVQRFGVGDRGIPYGYLTCGACRFCIAGRTSLCEKLTLRYGFGPVGGYSEYVLVPERFFVPVPDTVAMDEAAVASCSVVTAYHALAKRAHVDLGESVVIVGAGGGVGLHAVQLAHRMGGHVIAVDVDPGRESNALEHGADAFVMSDAEGFADAIQDLTNGQGAHVVFDAVASHHTMTESIRSLGSGGRLVLVGYRPSEPFTAATPDIVFREIEIYGSHWATMTDLSEVVDMIDRGLIDPIIIREFPLHEAPAALELLAVGGGPGRSVLTL
jgi:D-arabinose 1-dehydrogenase-like Zn-dependent alcohol dehydrogenase